MYSIYIYIYIVYIYTYIYTYIYVYTYSTYTYKPTNVCIYTHIGPQKCRALLSLLHTHGRVVPSQKAGTGQAEKGDTERERETDTDTHTHTHIYTRYRNMRRTA